MASVIHDLSLPSTGEQFGANKICSCLCPPIHVRTFSILAMKHASVNSLPFHLFTSSQPTLHRRTIVQHCRILGNRAVRQQNFGPDRFVDEQASKQIFRQSACVTPCSARIVRPWMVSFNRSKASVCFSAVLLLLLLISGLSFGRRKKERRGRNKLLL